MVSISPLDGTTLISFRHVLISVHQTNIVFVQTDFPEEYMAYIYSDQPSSQLPYLEIHRSREYDLRKPIDRLMAAEIIVALANVFAEQNNAV